MADTEPITVKNPLTPHAHGINVVDTPLTDLIPVGNGMPNNIPNGANNNNVSTILHCNDQSIVASNKTGVSSDVTVKTANSNGMNFLFSTLLSILSRSVRKEPIPVKSSSPAMITASV